MLVEEAGVEVEDAIADDVEAEVPGLDHARVDRADGDLVRVVTRDGDGPAVEPKVVVDERAERLVAGEVDAVEVVRLPLVPAGRGDEVDDRRRAASPSRRRSRAASSRPRRTSSVRTSRAAGGRVQAGEALAARQRLARRARGRSRRS